ncbi:MAG: McrB family protein [Candidatus Aenigmatarchaeota archaeon]
MERKFTWVDTHKAIVDYLIKMENSQKELIKLLKDVGISVPISKEKEGGEDIEINEIDPFTFFCCIYKYGEKNRLNFLKEIAKQKNFPIPEDVMGIPSAQPLAVRLFPYEYERVDEIERLWGFFKKAVSNNITEEDFEDILKISNVGKVKITELLFYINPNEYFPINAPTKSYLEEKLSINPEFNSYPEYREILDKVKDSIDQPYFEISYNAWKWNDNKSGFSSSESRKNKYSNVKDLIDERVFYQECDNANLLYNANLVTRFISSLITKPFVILTGLSGSGKTKLAEAFSIWISRRKEQYCMISVGADWTNRDSILGFPDALNPGNYIKPDNGALDLILQAEKDSSNPYFLILDEMNMSHVERYFADFLSAMESTDRTISLHPEGEAWEDCDVPAKMRLPENLFIIGTVNIDETTYMFSPKVLDRANVIEFRVSKSEMESYFNSSKELNMELLRGKGASMGESFVEKAKTKKLNDYSVKDELIPFFEKLQDAGAEFGYRTASEISRFVKICSESAHEEMSRKEVVDAAIMQKLLPKVHGSRNKIEKILKDLGQLCLKEKIEKEAFREDVEDDDILYESSYEKLKRMHKRVISDGFTSYAEA